MSASDNKSFWEKTKEAWNRGQARADNRYPGAKEDRQASQALYSNMAKGLYQAHRIDSTGAPDTSSSSNGNNRNNGNNGRT